LIAAKLKPLLVMPGSARQDAIGRGHEMADMDFNAELQRLQLMINAVRGTLREEDTEAALLLQDITERLLTLSEVAEGNSGIEEEVVQARLDILADTADRS
jgi:hypothetical protein